MNDQRESVSFEGDLSVSQVQSYLEEIQAGIEAGSVWVHRGEEAVELTPRDGISFRLEAKRRGNRQSLKIGMKWRLADEARDAGGALTISKSKPGQVLGEEAEKE